jgi:transcriptional regulator with XRE-family HTH domain
MPKAKKRVTEFGARLTTLRKAAGYTEVELAAALGTTQRMIAYYESRAEKAPAALLPQMAEVLGVSADELLGIKPLKRSKSKPPDTRLQRLPLPFIHPLSLTLPSGHVDDAARHLAVEEPLDVDRQRWRSAP